MHLVALPNRSYCTNFTLSIKTVAPNVPKNARRPRGGFYRDGFDATQKHRLKRLMVSILADPTKIPKLVPPSRDPHSILILVMHYTHTGRVGFSPIEGL